MHSLICGLFASLLAAMVWAQTPPPSPVQVYWHNWADGGGVSHWAKCAFTNWTWEEFLPPSSLWVENFAGPTQLVNMITPPGWVGPWHKNPEPQLVFVMSGVFLFTAMDETNITFTAGDIFFGNDQLSTKGHYSQNIGSVNGLLVAVQFANWNISAHAGVPCWLH